MRTSSIKIYRPSVDTEIMGSLSRYIRDPKGLRRLVEFLETTPLTRREELMRAGSQEHPEVVQLANEYIITFADIVELPQMELTEVLSQMKAKHIAFCALSVIDSHKEKILNAMMKNLELEVHSYMDFEPKAAEIGQARLAAIKAARQLESESRITLKRIPRSQTIEDILRQRKIASKREAADEHEGDLDEFESSIGYEKNKIIGEPGPVKGPKKIQVVEEDTSERPEIDVDGFDDLNFDGLFGGDDKKKKKKAG